MQLASRLDAAATPRGAKRTWREKLRQVSASLALERAWSKDEILEAYLESHHVPGGAAGNRAPPRGASSTRPLRARRGGIAAAGLAHPLVADGHRAVARRAARLAERTVPQRRRKKFAALAAETLGRPSASGPRWRLPLTRRGCCLRAKGDSGRDARSTASSRRSCWRRSTGSSRSSRSETCATAPSSSSTTARARSWPTRPTRAAPRAHPTWTASGRCGRRAPRSSPSSTAWPSRSGSSRRPPSWRMRPCRSPRRAASTCRRTTTGNFSAPSACGRRFRPRSTSPPCGSLCSSRRCFRGAACGLLGMESLDREADYYGYSLALGSAEVTLYELVNAYRTLANGGRWGRLKIAAGEAAEKTVPVMDARGRRDRLGHPLGPRGPQRDLRPGKTRWPPASGRPSRRERARTCATTGAWATPNATPSGSGWETSGRAHVERLRHGRRRPGVARHHDHLHRRAASNAPRAVAGIVAQSVSFRTTSSLRGPRWFIEGTEPQGEMAFERRHAVARIVYPQPSTIITSRPGLPAELQRVSFVGRFAGGTHEWRLDDRAPRLLGHACLEARARPARADPRRSGGTRGRRGHLRREMTRPPYPQAQRPYRANISS